MHADSFVSKHIKFLSGHVKLANVTSQDKHLEIIENNESIMEQITEEPPTVNDHNELTRTDNINKINVDCPVCANGDKPTGTHVRYICKKAVHAIDACSMSIGEEGYGQKRICKSCNASDDINEILATREVEDWKGLVCGTSSKGRYLQRGNLEQDFLLNKLQKIPIIKNDGNINVKSVQVGYKKISLTNTCAFDSILQLFISAYFDKKHIKDLIHKENSNIFFKLVLNIVTHCGVRA